MSPETWALIEKSTIIAAIGGVVTLVFGYIRSLSGKVGKEEYERSQREFKEMIEHELEQINKRVSKWEAEAKDFARNDSIKELKADMREGHAELKAQLSALLQQVAALSARGER